MSFMDDKEFSYSAKKDDSSKSLSMSLRHEVGYTFHYDGNGIDAKDEKEIEEAMKIIKPMYEKFLEDIKKSDEFIDNSIVANSAQDIKKYLPKFDQKASNVVLKEKTLDTFDDILKVFERNDKIVQNSIKLLDKLFGKKNSFEFYA